MSYILSEETQDIIEAVHEFCENEVKERAKEYDRTGEWPAELYEMGKEMQLHLMEVPEEQGGLGLDRLSTAAILEEMAKADAGFALTYGVSGMPLIPILKFGTKEQIEMVCSKMVEGSFGAFALTEPQAGSDAAAGKTTARKEGDEYILNGRKTFITNGGYAGIYVVTAMTDKSKGLKGMSAFIVEAGTPGFSSGNHEDKMGIRGSNTCDLVFEDCRIPAKNLLGKEGEGFKVAMQTLDVSRTYVGCMALGIAQRALEEAVAYAKERHQFKLLKNQPFI
ncbi:MAG: acyl-CoA dehydrogenase [Clostridia bacterium]|nr:acyl-CoA dehydrogenase [Clostridia bacterium]NCD01768.1 acyl-CoA dehydrogenase [Clostridia bacterium]